MTVEDWLRAAVADAERRGLGQLIPLLEALAQSTVALREAETPYAPGRQHLKVDEDR